MQQGNYQAILFHPEGDFVVDFREQPTKKDVWDCISDMGSRWIFYPIAFVATDKTIVDIPDDCPEWFRGKRIKTVQAFLKKEWATEADKICKNLESGLPLSFIYNV